MPFAIAGAAVSAGVGLYASQQQSKAVKSGQDASIAAQQQALDTARADLEPWRTGGTNALMVASDLAGANGPDAAAARMGDFYTSPGYGFRLSEGLRGVDAGAAAKGILRSGATLKAEQAFGEGLASSEFANYYNRLFDLSKMGENAAAKSGDQSVATGQGISAVDQNAAGAQSSIIGNEGKAIGDFATGVGNKLAYGNQGGGLNSLFGSGGGSNWNIMPSTGFAPSGGNTWYK